MKLKEGCVEFNTSLYFIDKNIFFCLTKKIQNTKNRIIFIYVEKKEKLNKMWAALNPPHTLFSSENKKGNK